jgi:hypothetical protein
MEKNSMELMEQALAILKIKNGDRTDLAYAEFAGYSIAAVDLKTAKTILDYVKGSN